MWKKLLKFMLIAVCYGLAMLLTGRILSPRLPEVDEDFTPVPLEVLKTNFQVTYDFQNPLVIPQKVDYSHGPQAPWWPKDQSPLLRGLVEQGVLPPVAERVGSEPLVLRGVDGIGRHGGVWLRLGANVIQGRVGQIGLMRWSPGGYPRVLNVARHIEHSEDWKTFTVHMRKGMKWSDGYPFTTEAVEFYFEHLEVRGEQFPRPYRDADGKPARITILDEHTFRIEYDLPRGDFYDLHMEPYMPGHYLRQYHHVLGDPENIQEVITAYKLGSPRAAFAFMMSRENPDLPSIYPWIYRAYNSVDPQVYVRNPYFWAVDTEGNQLPYIDAIQTMGVDIKMLPIRAAQGEATILARGLDFSYYTELKDKAIQAGRQNIYLWYPNFTAYYLQFSLHRLVDPARPETKWKAKLLADKRFRQAFSVAINRERIIKAMFHGMGTPEQMKLFYPYDQHPIKDAYAQYDPDKASELFDELGLTQRDTEDFRMFPDGTRAFFYIDNNPGVGLGPSEFIADDLARVGLRVISRLNGNVALAMANGDYDIANQWSGNSVGYEWRFIMGMPPRWTAHVRSGGALPLPPRQHEAFYSGSAGKGMELLRIIAQKTPEERIPYLNQLLDITAEEVYTISFSSPLPSPVVVAKDVRNVPQVAVYDHSLGGIGCAGSETFFFEIGDFSPVLETQLVNSIVSPVLRPGASTRSVAGGMRVGRLLKPLLLLLFAGSIVLLVLKYPFTLKRIVIMIPTLLIISVISFTVVQLPPGDFLQSEMSRLLEEDGENKEVQDRIREIKEMFHYGEPKWKSYCRWSGLYWFRTFDRKDTGLLQGNLGRSMRTMRPINAMIAERLGFTMALALTGIILGYTISWPIGIICAVKKGGITDYSFMFFGFLAMCVPSFIIGLIFMVISGKSGLFSPEFATQPNWDWPKFLDFLGHIWIPISIILINCISGGGRIFRANILDELKKPYVVTARAKGVRPLKLLLKYPVRMALNPWASSVGSIFPALVSDNALLAIVIGLPTLGPMMLEAIMGQDVYLACANLMLLSSLSVFGVLVSDIMLIIVDPRIKYGKGG